MRKQANTGKVWTKPQITRLGEIQHVGANQTPLAQTPGTSKS